MKREDILDVFLILTGRTRRQSWNSKPKVSLGSDSSSRNVRSGWGQSKGSGKDGMHESVACSNIQVEKH